MATINKTRPSCARVKVHIDLLSEFPKYVEMGIVNEKASRVEKVHIYYDMLPKYCKACKLQGLEEIKCLDNSSYSIRGACLKLTPIKTYISKMTLSTQLCVRNNL